MTGTLLPFLVAGWVAADLPTTAPDVADITPETGSEMEAIHKTLSSDGYEPAPSASVSWLLAADSVRAGDVLVVQLPDSLSGVPISGYSASRLPLKSWLLEKSFVWSTDEGDKGEHALELDALPVNGADSTDTIPFSLHVVVW